MKKKASPAFFIQPVTGKVHFIVVCAMFEYMVYALLCLCFVPKFLATRHFPRAALSPAALQGVLQGGSNGVVSGDVARPGELSSFHR